MFASFREWGIADVEDVVSAADTWLGVRNRPDRIVLAGSSAGGLTVYSVSPDFPEVSCRNRSLRVADLCDLASRPQIRIHYLIPVGSLPDHSREYVERSPSICGLDSRSACHFSGEEDRAVPKAHSDAIVQSLCSGVCPLYRVFPVKDTVP